MAQAIRKAVDDVGVTPQLARRLREGALIALWAAAVFVLMALVSYHRADPGWSHTGAGGAVHNLGGIAGAWVADLLLYLFGLLAYLLPLVLAGAGRWVLRVSRGRPRLDAFHLTVRATGLALVVVGGCALAALRTSAPASAPAGAGGILGEATAAAIGGLFGAVGGALLMVAAVLAGVTLLTGLSWLRLAELTGERVIGGVEWLRRSADVVADYLRGWRSRRRREAVVRVERKRARARPKPRIEPKITRLERGERVERERQRPLFEAPATGELPPVSLLDPPSGEASGYSQETLEALSRQVELKLRDFGVEAEVVAVHPGPVITRFELQPAPGIKVSRITNLSKDLARSLSTTSVRVVEVIPGKSVIGLEIPNEQRETVYLSEILGARAYEQSGSVLSLALGKDISGSPVVADLARMPHLLVAGTTGSGKSVALNAMILSLLYKSTPRDVRLILIDPKMLELSVYDGIPALLTPVVTDMKEAANALRWCVGEMERRYRLMAALGVRNIGGYNRKVAEAARRGRPIPDPFAEAPADGGEPPALDTLPHIVVVIDELADMMMTVGKKVEQLIARLAQKARAAGIHLIVATQRPSVDVITGLIKANIPSRIAFQVSSRVDSRTILDQMGAETLLGHGDMLYLPPGTAVPQRVHGAFVSDAEVHRVVEHLRKSGTPEYLDEVTSGDAGLAGGGDGAVLYDGADEVDPLYDEAVRIVVESRRASISGVQRRLKIGYNRAARIVEQMERAGVVGPVQSNGSREVLAPAPQE